MSLCCCTSYPEQLEIPSASSFASAKLKGNLNKLVGRNWLCSGSLRKRFCLISGSKLYFYEDEKSKGSEKSAGVISLDYYDICEEVDEKEFKRVTNVFVIYSSVGGLFDVKHIFSAETLPEMNKWISAIQSAIADARHSRRVGSSRRFNNSGQKGETKTESMQTNETSDVTLTPIDNIDPSSTLTSATKHRPKGPFGRRLPQRKSMLGNEVVTSKLRTQSMSMIEENPEMDDFEDEVDASDKKKSKSLNNLNDTTTKNIDDGKSSRISALIYDYSSDEDDNVDQSDKVGVYKTPHRRYIQVQQSDPANDDAQPKVGDRIKAIGPIYSKQVPNLVQELQKRYLATNTKVQNDDPDAKEQSPLNGEVREPQRQVRTQVKDMNTVLGELKYNVSDMESEMYRMKRDIGTLQNKLTDVCKKNEEDSQQQVKEMIESVDHLQDKAKVALQDANKAKDEFESLKGHMQDLMNQI